MEEKIVLTYGTFDLLHPGHINILKRAKSLGDRLYVGLSTDEFCKEKGKTTVLSYSQRKEVLESVKYVDGIFPEMSLTRDKMADGMRYGAHVFVWGDDWAGTFDFLRNDGFKVIYFPRTKGISTSLIKDDLKNR